MTAPDPGGSPVSLGRAPPPIVGLRRERGVLTVALDTGQHVVIEGPPGTGKSTLLRDIARHAHLARRGGGVSQPVRRLTDVAPALTRVLSA